MVRPGGDSRRRSISLLWGWVDVHVRFSFLYNEELNMISLRGAVHSQFGVFVKESCYLLRWL
jgi:hypothetical protein